MSIDPRLGEGIASSRRQGNLDQQGLQAWEVREATLAQLESTLRLPGPELAQFDSRQVLSVVVYAAASGSALEPAPGLEGSPLSPHGARTAQAGTLGATGSAGQCGLAHPRGAPPGAPAL